MPLRSAFKDAERVDAFVERQRERKEGKRHG